MAKEIDARGLSCPTPVLMTKKAIETEKSDITVIVDNEASRQNVCRFLESQNFTTYVKQKGSDFHVVGMGKEAASSQPAQKTEPASTKKILVMVSSDCMGRGDDELGAKLMLNFLKTLKEMGNDLWRLIFVNNGVKLTVEHAEALPILSELEQGGVRILVCGTCLSHFNLLDKKRVGETTNMLDIVTAMQMADKAIHV
jgi:selenium metabolism protein YedF